MYTSCVLITVVLTAEHLFHMHDTPRESDNIRNREYYRNQQRRKWRGCLLLERGGGVEGRTYLDESHTSQPTM